MNSIVKKLRRAKRKYIKDTNSCYFLLGEEEYQELAMYFYQHVAILDISGCPKPVEEMSYDEYLGYLEKDPMFVAGVMVLEDKVRDCGISIARKPTTKDLAASKLETMKENMDAKLNERISQAIEPEFFKEADEFEAAVQKVMNAKDSELVAIDSKMVSHVMDEVARRKNKIQDAFDATEFNPPKGGTMDFSTALRKIKRGIRVMRRGWNGKNLYIAMCGPLDIKEGFIHSINTPFLVIVNTEARTTNTWVPSVSDLFAEDWQIVE
jgi:hypothetical protein